MVLNMAGQIKVLEHIQAVQKRPQMFIGETTTPTHLWIEAIDNARDECLSGHSNRLDVFTEDTKLGKCYVVRDWGRGIPITSTEVEGDVPIAIATKLYSGGKFESGLYDFSSGLHGVGITVINALSDYLWIFIKTKTPMHYLAYTFKDGQFIQKNEVKLTLPIEDCFSTEIRFIPSKRYFDSIECDNDQISQILNIARYGLDSKVSINFNHNPVQDTLVDNFKGENCAELISESYTDRRTGQYCKIDIALYEDFDSGKQFTGVVNLLSTNEGNHASICNNAIKNKLFDISQKGKNKYHLQQNDLLVPIRILCTLKIKEPRFPAQTKGKLVTNKDQLNPIILPAIENIIKKNPKFFDTVIQQAEAYRVNLQTSKTTRKSTIGKIVKVHGLKDCSSKDPKECSIFIVEGESAGTTLTKCRNPKYHAYLALRGKILNVIGSKATTAKILSNEVISNIAMALGYRLFQPVDAKKCRYGKIILLSDADFDGKHISVLLINVFYKMFPELIKAGMIYVAQPPLYGTWVKKKFVPIFTEEEKERYSLNGTLIQRFKGLGEMDPQELYYSAVDESTRKCLQLKWEDFSMEQLWEEKLGHLANKTYKPF